MNTIEIENKEICNLQFFTNKILIHVLKLQMAKNNLDKKMEC
jgi:hypothetical protein